MYVTNNQPCSWDKQKESLKSAVPFKKPNLSLQNSQFIANNKLGLLKTLEIFLNCKLHNISMNYLQLREGDVPVPKLTLKLGSASPCPDNQDTRKL